MSKIFIYSTLTAANIFHVFKEKTKSKSKKEASPNSIKYSITINGGANVHTRFTHEGAPKGALTVVSASDLAILEKNTIFKEFVKNGFIKVDKTQRIVEQAVDKAVKDMEASDGSAQATSNDLANAKVNADNGSSGIA